MLAALSAGPVGVGDRIGECDVDLIRRTCRADGVLVRPDVPVAAIDRAMFDAPVWSGAVLVGSAYSQHSAGRWGYVFAGNVGNDKIPADAEIAFAAVGEDRPETERIAVFDWRTGRVDVLPADGAYTVALQPSDWDYRVLAPVLEGDIAVIGDPTLYAGAGDARLGDVAVAADGIAVTVLGAQERVRIVGWSERAIAVRAWSPALGSVELEPSYDASSGMWEVAVDIGAAGWIKLFVGPRVS